MNCVHVVYARTFFNKYFLILVYAYNKWVEMYLTNSTITKITIEHLQENFARFRLSITLEPTGKNR